MGIMAWAAAVALAWQAVAPAPSMPLVPTGKWQVAFEEDLCVMSHEFGEAARPMTLAVRPFPMNDRAEIVVLAPSNVTTKREGDAQVAFAPGRTLPATYQAFGIPGKLRIIHVYLDRALLAELRRAGTVTITADKASYAFAVPKTASALTVLDQCEGALLTRWGIDPALKTGSLAHVQGDPARAFSPNDYPKEALRYDRQGRTVALLAITAEGSVSGCRVVKSAGAAIIDEQTCRIARQRLRFDPPRDASGAAVASQYLLPVRWALPGS